MGLQTTNSRTRRVSQRCKTESACRFALARHTPETVRAEPSKVVEYGAEHGTAMGDPSFLFGRTVRPAPRNPPPRAQSEIQGDRSRPNQVELPSTARRARILWCRSRGGSVRELGWSAVDLQRRWGRFRLSPAACVPSYRAVPEFCQLL